MAEDRRPVNIVPDLVQREVPGDEALDPGDEVREVFSQRQGCRRGVHKERRLRLIRSAEENGHRLMGMKDRLRILAGGGGIRDELGLSVRTV